MSTPPPPSPRLVVRAKGPQYTVGYMGRRVETTFGGTQHCVCDLLRCVGAGRPEAL